MLFCMTGIMCLFMIYGMIIVLITRIWFLRFRLGRGRWLLSGILWGFAALVCAFLKNNFLNWRLVACRCMVSVCVNARVISSGCDTKNGQEHDHTDAVIKKRFAYDFGLQFFRDTRSLKNSQNGNRIGWRNKSTEKQAFDELCLNPDPRKSKMNQCRTDKSRSQNTER